MAQQESLCLTAAPISSPAPCYLYNLPLHPRRCISCACHGYGLHTGKILVLAWQIGLCEPSDTRDACVSAAVSTSTTSSLKGIHTSSVASKRGMALRIRSLRRRDACAPSSCSFCATSLSSSMLPAILHHVLCFNKGLLSR